MSKDRFYAVVVVLLLLINIGTLSFLWVSKKDKHIPPPMHHRPDPGEIIARELQLDEQQRELFNQLKHEHRRGMDSVHRVMKDMRSTMFELVKQDEINVLERDSLLNEIGKVEAAKELVTIEHFHQLNKILRDDQKEAFNRFIDDISRRPGPPGMRGHGPPPPPRH